MSLPIFSSTYVGLFITICTRNELVQNVQPDNKNDKMVKKCPSCAKELAIQPYHGKINIDVCALCGGIWLDGGEFAIIYYKIEKNHHKDILKRTLSIIV